MLPKTAPGVVPEARYLGLFQEPDEASQRAGTVQGRWHPTGGTFKFPTDQRPLRACLTQQQVSSPSGSRTVARRDRGERLVVIHKLFVHHVFDETTQGVLVRAFAGVVGQAS